MFTRPDFPSVISEHPIRPVAFDPLAPAGGDHPSQVTVRPTTSLAPPRIGYACLWEPTLERTWSGSATNLRGALRKVTATTDVGVRLSPLSRAVLKALHTRYHGARLTTTWVYSPLTDAYIKRALCAELKRNQQARRCEAVLQIDDLAILPIPFFTYYDSSWDLLISAVDNPGALAALRAIAPSMVSRRRDRQVAIYEKANGVFAFSHWHARSLVEQSSVPERKVRVIHPAINASVGPRERPHRGTPRRRLLFVGRQHQYYDFYRKGGDLVVAALAILRRDYDPRITLTIVGLEHWPLPGETPDGVRMLGILPAAEVAALYDHHDLFVMPSRFEPFGLAIAEAIARGLPSVARNACAMPEMVTPGISGALIDGDDPHELAATIASTLADDALYASCAARAPAYAAYFSWERTAGQMVQAIAEGLSG